jgi:hypothetical protein
MKQLYAKPTLSKVELVTSEALSHGCKNDDFYATGPDGAGPDCEPGGQFDQCIDDAS